MERRRFYGGPGRAGPAGGEPRAGALAALRRHLSEYAAATGLRIDVCGPGLDGVRLPAEASITLFRIAQEAAPTSPSTPARSARA